VRVNYLHVKSNTDRRQCICSRRRCRMWSSHRKPSFRDSQDSVSKTHCTTPEFQNPTFLTLPSMQLQGELQKTSSNSRIYNGPLHGLKVIIRNEGIRGVYSGFGAGSAYQLLLNGSRIGFYEPIRSNLTSFLYTDANKQSFGISVFSGPLSGVIGAMLGSPFFLVKTRMQTYSKVAPMGTQHVYTSTWNGLKKIYRSEGLKGLYRGCDAAIVRTGIGSSAKLPCYYAAQKVLIERTSMKVGTILHLIDFAFDWQFYQRVCCVLPDASCR